MQVTVAEAVREYEIELKSLGRADATITRYMVYLRAFTRTVGGQSSVSAAVTPAKMTQFFATITTAHTRNGTLAALRGFTAWAVRMRYLRPAAAVEALGGRQTKAVHRQPKHYIDVSEFPKLLDCAGETHPIERAVIALALYTLCRQSEIIGLKLGDVDLANRELSVYRNKRSRHTTVTISPDLFDELDNWLSWYACKMGLGMGPAAVQAMMTRHPDWRLIPHWAYGKERGPRGFYVAGDGQAAITPTDSPARLEYVLKRALTASGVSTRNGRVVDHLGEGIHTIRRSGARALLDHLEGPMGADRALLMVSAMLDHDDTQMTLRYIGRHIDKQRLDNYLKSNSMYGGQAGNVVPLHRAI